MGQIRNILKCTTVYKPSVAVLLKLTECQGMTERAITYSNSPNVIMVLEYSNDLNPGLTQPVELPEKALPIVLIYKTNHVLVNEIKLSYLLYGPHKLNRSIHNKVEGEHNKNATALTGIYINYTEVWLKADSVSTNLAVEDIEQEEKNKLLA